MTLESVFEALHIHARGSADAKGSGLADVLWRYERGSKELDLDAVWVDLVQLFQAMYPECSAWHDSGVPVSVSYAVAEILVGVTQLSLVASDEEARRQAALLCFRVALSWEALMAGDFDDVAEHVRLEEWALRLGPDGESLPGG